MTGPLYERKMPQLPGADEPHLIPSGYWKIVAIEANHTVLVAAFILDQGTPRDADYCAHRVTVDEVEQRSGLNVFHELSETEQAALEGGPGTLRVQLGC